VESVYLGIEITLFGHVILYLLVALSRASIIAERCCGKAVAGHKGVQTPPPDLALSCEFRSRASSSERLSGKRIRLRERLAENYCSWRSIRHG